MSERQLTTKKSAGLSAGVKQNLTQLEVKPQRELDDTVAARVACG